MKKLIGLALVAFTTLLLVACSAKETLDGKYYWIDDSRHELIAEIKGNKGVAFTEGDLSFEVDEDLKVIKYTSNVVDDTSQYSYEDGVLTADFTGVEREYYKKGTKAFNDALKENALTEADIEE